MVAHERPSSEAHRKPCQRRKWQAPQGIDDVRANGAKDAAALAGIRPPSECARGHWEEHVCLHHKHLSYAAAAQVLARPQESRRETQLVVNNDHLHMHGQCRTFAEAG